MSIAFSQIKCSSGPQTAQANRVGQVRQTSILELPDVRIVRIKTLKGTDMDVVCAYLADSASAEE